MAVNPYFRIKTLNPVDPLQEKVDVKVPRDLIAELFRRGHKTKYMNLEAAREVLEGSPSIFIGIRMETGIGMERGGYCYAGRPSMLYNGSGKLVEFPSDKVYAVYVSTEMELYEWRDEYADKDDPEFPINWRERYASCKWKNIS